MAVVRTSKYKLVWGPECSQFSWLYSCSSNFEVWNIGVTHPRTQVTLFRMVTMGAAVTKNRLIHPITNQTPYSWIRNVLWYELYLSCDTIFPGLLCIHFMILAEILTVDDVITHLWRHYCRIIDDIIWLSSTWYDLIYPFQWSCQVSSQMGHFELLWTNSLIQRVLNSSFQGHNTK